MVLSLADAIITIVVASAVFILTILIVLYKRHLETVPTRLDLLLGKKAKSMAIKQKPFLQRLLQNRLKPAGAKSGDLMKKEVVACYSPKGGVGKTTVASNLAIAYKQNKEVKTSVCLIDLDVSWGNVESVMCIKNKEAPTVLDWEPFIDKEINEELLDTLVYKHPSGVDVVASPATVEDAFKINDKDKVCCGAKLTDKVIKVLREHYDVVVIDLGASMTEDSTIVAMDSATRIIMIATADYPTLRNLVHCAGSFENLALDQSKTMIVFNMMLKDKKGVKDIGKYVSCPVIAKIPFEEKVQYMTNSGEIPYLADSKLFFSKEMRNIVNSITPLYPRKSESLIKELKRRLKNEQSIAKTCERERAQRRSSDNG